MTNTRPVNNLSAFALLVLNLAVIVILTLYLADKVTLPCVAPYQVSALSVAVIVLMFFHLIWRNVYVLFPSNVGGSPDGILAVGVLKLPFRILLNLLNELHPWGLHSRQLGALVVTVLVVIAFLNLSAASPFHVAIEPLDIKSFSIQRLDSGQPEQLAPGQMLTITMAERVFVEVVLLGEAETSCTWFTATGGQNTGKACSIVFSVPSGTSRDTLTVLLQSACGTRQRFASLHVAAQPSINVPFQGVPR